MNLAFVHMTRTQIITKYANVQCNKTSNVHMRMVFHKLIQSPPKRDKFHSMLELEIGQNIEGKRARGSLHIIKHQSVHRRDDDVLVVDDDDDG